MKTASGGQRPPVTPLSLEGGLDTLTGLKLLKGWTAASVSPEYSFCLLGVYVAIC